MSSSTTGFSKSVWWSVSFAFFIIFNLRQFLISSKCLIVYTVAVFRENFPSIKIRTCMPWYFSKMIRIISVVKIDWIMCKAWSAPLNIRMGADILHVSWRDMVSTYLITYEGVGVKIWNKQISKIRNFEYWNNESRVTRFLIFNSISYIYECELIVIIYGI